MSVSTRTEAMETTRADQAVTAPAAPPLRRGGFGQNAMQVALIFVLVIAVWEGAVRLFNVPAFILPAPSSVVQAFVRTLATGTLLRNTWATLIEAVGGFALGSLGGIVLGTLVASSRTVERLVYPYIVAFQTMPKVAVAPLFAVWFGLGLESKIMLAALVSFFPLLVNVIAGLRTVDRERIDLMRSLDASDWQIFTMLRLPNALPFIFAGLDVAIVFSVIGAIVGEFAGAQAGLGYLIQSMNYTLDVSGMFAVLVVLGAIGLSFHLIMQAVERRVVFWAQHRDDPTLAA